jgi:hypothetical protein
MWQVRCRPNKTNVIHVIADIARFELPWTAAMGQPVRHNPGLLTLRKGETGRLITNGRYSSYSGQYYKETMYNLAFNHSLAPDVFLHATVSAVVDMRGDLF